ncbi:hypothetical protein [Streptomyces triticisoli]|jgi:hypothetical protein|uniref:hypothetical protein n=1 Tax=Streptomyces triticisoli TaxID=2182797 RepID=UPI000DD78FE6|nr:hypothetical protein [Streptomyces triticisoli]
MTPKNEAGLVIAHLAAVWFIGSVLTGLQFYAVMIALFTDNTAIVAVVLALVISLAVAAFAGLGAMAHPIMPVTRQARGLWRWASGVYGLGTAGALGTIVTDVQADHHLLENSSLLYLAGGIWYAVAAAFFLPGARAKPAALGVATALVAGAAYAAWAAAQPPTLDEWLTANGVDRALLRVGDPPPGYTLESVGASEDGFGAAYERSGSAGLHLGVARAGHDTRRADSRGCPVPFGDPIHCTDDGGGRLLVTYQGGYERQELRLRRTGLVHTVTVQGTGATDLPAARHILSTLRPASDTELAGLVELPMRR